MISGPTASLLKQLVLRDLRLRYRSTMFGFLWSFVRPVTMIVIFYMVFAVFLDFRAGVFGMPEAVNYGLFLAIGILSWTFFSSAVSEGTSTYLVHQQLISRACFWRPALPFSNSLSHWIHYLLTQFILIVVLGVAGCHSWGFSLFLLVPISIAELALVTSVVWILSALNVFARDTAQFADLGLMVLFYASPIIYPAHHAILALEKYHAGFLYLANPLAPCVMLRQKILLWESAGGGAWPLVPAWSIGFSIIVTIVLAFTAVQLNQRMNRVIADKL